MDFTTKYTHAFIICLSLLYVHGSENEDRLFKHLFRTYNKDVRPVVHDNETVMVKIKHTISQILDVEERKELFVTSGWSSLRWHDCYLKWDPKDFNGITSVNFTPQKIWIPDILLYDDFKTDKVFGSHVDEIQNRLTVDYNGQIIWGLRTTFVTKCHLDIYYFPFDTQTCEFTYGSWTHEASKIDVSPDSHIGVDSYAHPNGWDLLNLSKEMVLKNYSGNIYRTVVFSVTFKRKAFVASVNLIVPPIIIGTLVLHSFVLPAASGERLALSITLLLAIIFFIINVTHMIPSDNIAMPVVYQFFIVTLAEIVLQIIVIIFGMQLYHKKRGDPPMSRWLRYIVLDRVAYWVGTRSDQSNQVKEILSKAEMEAIIEVSFLSNLYCEMEKGSGDDRCNAHACDSEETGSVGSNGREGDTTLNDWRIVALTLDRCLFVTFLVVWIVTVLIFFLEIACDTRSQL